MSTHPSLESRVKALEHRQFNLETHTEELVAGIAASVKRLSADMNASFEQVVDYDMKTERKIDTRFNLVDARLDRLEIRFDQLDGRLNQVDTRLDKIEATMATKEDLAAINERLNRLETAFGEHSALLTQILERLSR
jgi:chromosome segregation ATPase